MVKPYTAESLERAALHYLGRYGSTITNFKTVLERKIKRRLPKGEPFDHTHREWIDNITKKCIEYKYLNDIVYAEHKIRSMRISGKSRRNITENLRSKGVAIDDIETAFKLFEKEEGQDDKNAAITFARKRRIGPYRREKGEVDYALKQKEFGKMARAGFDFDLIKAIIDARDEDALSDI